MDKYAILHISDLHITKFISDKKKKNYESRMENVEYSEVFINAVKKLQRDKNIKVGTIIVSGDLANRATLQEYNNVKKFFDNILKELQINVEDFIIVPGNHDINRVHLQDKHEDHVAKSGEISPNKLQTEKLSKFKEFYDQFYNNTNIVFDAERAICITKYIENCKLLIIGINSLYQESYLEEDHVGFINYDNLKDELKKLEDTYKDCFKIAVSHHSPIIITGHSEGVIKNWQRVQPLLNEININAYFYGHTHASLRYEGNVKDKKKYEFIGCGSFALSDNNISNCFNLYVLEDQNEDMLKFDVQTYLFSPGYDTESGGLGKWKFDDEKSGKLELLKCNSPNILKNEEGKLVEQEGNLFGKDQNQIEILMTHQIENINCNSEEIDKFADSFMKLVSEKNIFKSGHFHWGSNSRAHGWLDTNALLSDYESIKLGVNALLYLIKKNSMKADLIVGIGMEGNLLAPLISIALGAKYTYIPVTSRENCNFEQKITSEVYKNIVLVTDTVFSGETINQIINQYNTLFSTVDNLNLISLFYTGNLVESLAKRKNFNHKYVCDKIKINSCMNKSKESCPIYLNGLDVIYEL